MITTLQMYKYLPEALAQRLFESTTNEYGIVVELNLKGEIINSWHDPKGYVIHHISQVGWLTCW